MIIPDYRYFRGSKFVIATDQQLVHSAKGSTWEDHKYIKKVDGTYYYPDNYEGGRHLPESSDKKEEFDHEKAATEFNKFFKSLADAGTAYFGSKEEWESMSLDDFKNLYKNILGRDPDKELSKDALQNMFDSVKKQNTSDKMLSGEKLTDKDYDTLAKEVMKGNFGNGQERKNLLGERYAEVQKRVNEMMKGSAGSKKISSSKRDSFDKAAKAIKKIGNVVIKSRR